MALQSRTEHLQVLVLLFSTNICMLGRAGFCIGLSFILSHVLSRRYAGFILFTDYGDIFH